MEGSNLLVSKEGIWHPNFAGVSQGQVANSLWNIEDIFTNLDNKVISEIKQWKLSYEDNNNSLDEHLIVENDNNNNCSNHPVKLDNFKSH